MRHIILLALLLAPIGCGATKGQVDVALELNAAQATNYTDLAVFTRGVLQAGERAAPESQKQFWRDSLVSLDENVEQFAVGNKDLIRMILAMRELDPATQQKYVSQLGDLIVAAKTGKLPPAPTPAPEPEVTP